MSARHISYQSPPARLHMIEYGGEGKPPLLLTHGLAGNAHWWDGVGPDLARDFHTVALDFRGHGDSGWPLDPEFEISDYAADIGRALDGLGWERAHLACHSMGARAAIKFAGLEPARVERLALIDFLPAMRGKAALKFRRERKNIRQPHYNTESSILFRFRLEPDRTKLSPEKVREMGRHAIRRLEDGKWTWKFDWRAFLLSYAAVWDDLAAVRAPALVVRGEHSLVLPQDEYERVLEGLSGARGEVVRDAFHHVMLDQPQRTTELLAAFLVS